MPEFPDTRYSLIAKVRDAADQDAWIQFVRLYEPIVYRYGRSKGLQHADAEDLLQRVMMSIFNAVESWEQGAGQTRFRNWLSRIVRNATLNALYRKPRDQSRGGVSASEWIVDLAEPSSSVDDQFEWEYRREIYSRAAERVKREVAPETWEAFELTSVREISVEEAGRLLNKSLGSIYAARSRVMQRLQIATRELEDDES